MAENDKGSYALNTFEDIVKYDPLRLLDIGNLFQVGVSSGSIGDNEEARATSNFEKLVEDRPRPWKHTLIDATRLLPDIITTLAGPGFAAIKQAAKKKATKAAQSVGEEVAAKLVKETTEDAAKDFAKSLFFRRTDKTKAGQAWVNKLWENKEAMSRIAGRNLTDEEITAVRNAIPKAVGPQLDLQNMKIDKLGTRLAQSSEFFETEPRVLLDGLLNNGEFRSLYKKVYNLNSVEVETLIKNLKEVIENGKNLSFSHYDVERIIKGLPTEKATGILNSFKQIGKNALEFGKDTFNPVFTGLAGFSQGAKAADSIFKKNEQAKKDAQVTLGPLYFMEGAEPTPGKDFIASMFNMDYDDPARFNQEDIETFIKFLEKNKWIEPGSNEKLSPRQKVSVIRDIMKNKKVADIIKREWLNSFDRAEWY